MATDNIADLRKDISSRPLVPYDDLDANPNDNIDHLNNEIDRLLKNGWERWNHHLPTLEPPIPWHEERGSFDNALHSWEMMRVFLHAHRLTSDARYMELPIRIARDWLEQNFIAECRVNGENPTMEERWINAIIAQKSKALWYDMTVGQRIYRLAYILDVAARMPDVENEFIAWLYRALKFHHKLLARNEFFTATSNHGIYQALGQLAAARRFCFIDEIRPYKTLALRRVKALLDTHFFPSGAHKEHSPGYHYMVLGSFRGAATSGLFDDCPEIIERLHKMEFLLGAMIQPNGWLATIGDSDPRQLVSQSSIASRFDERTLKYILGDKENGSAPSPGMISCHDAGYAFARLYAPDVEPVYENASYLAQIAGFHSRVHKHADHLSFVWFDKKREILTDPARYAYAGRTERGSELARQGFYYSDPKRIYVESTRAHNCVEIDERDYPRAGRHGKPFGSALKHAGEQQGMAITECETTHFGSILHWRGLIMKPGHFLLVLDWLHERAMWKKHDYRQWFKFHPDWKVRAKENGLVEAFHEGGDGLPAQPLRAAELSGGASLPGVARGLEEPRMQGWYSDEAYSLIPASSLHFLRQATRTARFATIFVLDEELLPLPEKTRINATMRKGRLAWKDGRGEHMLEFDRTEPDQPMRISLRTTNKA